MYRTIHVIITFCYLAGASIPIQAQTNLFSRNALRADFQQFRQILENEHCCLYEYTPKAEMDSLFEAHFQLIDHEMKREEFFMLLAPITAKIGCMHTAAWMPGKFFVTKPTMMFPLTLKLIDEQIIVSGSSLPFIEVPHGSNLLEINKKPIEEIVEQLRKIISADALNPYFINAQMMERFPLLYASAYGLPDQYEIIYLSPGKTKSEIKTLTPTSHESVRHVVFSNFNNPPLDFEVVNEKNTAIMTVPTFIYYDKVEYFRNFMDSCFHLIKKKGISNLILDVSGNDGGDPFCSSILLSYLQKSPLPYFAEPYGKYRSLSDPLPNPEDNYKGHQYTLIDGSCGSTNGHFCAVLKYHRIGKFIGTPSGATYKCNAGKDTEFRLINTQTIITIGRTTYSAAVTNMDNTAILPDIYVYETHDDFIHYRDVFLEKAFEQMKLDNQ